MASQKEDYLTVMVNSMTQNDILVDLLRRRPRGPAGKNITYTTVRGEWCYKKHDYKSIIKCSEHQFGYTDDELFSLGFMSRLEVDAYFRLRDFEGKSNYKLGRIKSTLTRRVNLVWERIESAVYRVSREGREGIYSISQLYSSDKMGHIYARNMDEASESAKLFFGYLAPEANLFKVKFVKMGTVTDLPSLNKVVVNQIQKQIESHTASLEYVKKNISRLEAMLTTINTVESQQIAVETVYALNNID